MQKKHIFMVWALLFCCLQQIFPGSVTLSIKGARAQEHTKDGTVVYEVDPQQKFKVLVVSSGQESLTTRPKVSGLESFKQLSTSQSSGMTSINGRVSNMIQFEHYVMGEEEGDYTLGPVSTAHGSCLPCIVRVRQRSQQEAYKDFQKEYRNGAVCQVQLSTDKKSYFVGEHIPVTVQIYCWDQEVEVESIQPYFEEFSVQDIPEESTEMELDGKKARVITKKYFLTSLWAGEKKIKPVSVQYVVPAEDFDDFMFSNTMFFGPTKMVNRQEIQSNGLEIELKNLPPSNKTSDGLGTFSSFILSVDKNIVDVKSLINVSLNVVGKGNFSQLSAPRLRLPKSMRVFPGITQGDLIKREDNSGDFEKKFTYVVQPLKPGKIIIPSQEFFYFDPKDQQYHALNSQELAIIVEGDEEGAPQTFQAAEPKKSAKKVEHPVSQGEEERSISVESWADESLSLRWRGLNWYIWAILAIVLFTLGLMYERLVAWSDRRRKNPKRALGVALRSLAASNNKTYGVLFEVTMHFLNMRFFNLSEKHLA